MAMQIPRVTNPTVSTAPLPGVRQSVATPIGAFGNGQALEQAGQGLRQAGSDLDAVVKRIQDRQTTDEFMGASTALSSWNAEWQRAITNRKGQDAWGAYADTQKELQGVADKIRKSLTSNNARRLFDHELAQRSVDILGYAGRYEDEQRRGHTVDVNNARIEGMIGAAAGDPTSTNLAAAQEAIGKGISTVASLNGWTPEQVQAEKRRLTGKLDQQVVEGLLVTNPRQAQAYLDGLAPEARAALPATTVKAVSIGTMQLDAQEFADRVMASGVSETEALKQIRKTASGDSEDTYVAAVKARFNERDAAEARADKAAREAVWNAIAQSNGDLSKVPPQALARLDEYDQERARAYADTVANGRSVKTSRKDYTSLSEMYRSDPTTFRGIDLTKYQLSDSDHQYFEGLKNSVDQAAKAFGNQTALDAISLDKQISNTIDTLFPQSGSELSEEIRAAKAVFAQSAAEAIDREQRAKGRRLDQPERQKIIDGLAIQGEVVKDWADDPQLPLGAVLGTPDEANWRPTITEAQQQKVVKRLTAELKRAPTEEEIDFYYLLAVGAPVSQ